MTLNAYENILHYPLSMLMECSNFLLGSFSHGFTYSGHPVACAVALEAVKIYKYDFLVLYFVIPSIMCLANVCTI